MVTTTSITAPLSTQGAFSSIAAISQTLTPMLEKHGETSLIAGLAHAIGVSRILAVAANAKTKFLCAPVTSDGEPRRTLSEYRLLATAGQGTIVTFYFAGCDGAKALRDRLGRSIFKGGFTCRLNPEDRLGGLNEVAYGAWCVSQHTLDPAKPALGWNDWSFARHETSDTAHLILPEGVFVESGLWHVYLPAGIDPSMLDRMVTAAMMPRQLAFWAMSGEGKTYCAQHKLDPREFVRFGLDADTGLLRPVEELYVYSPRHDAHWFAAILADALARVRAGAISH